MTELLINALIAIATFFIMEGVAWFTHKYIMHGFLWTWHASHHKPRKGRWERNDLFAVVFSLPSIALFVYSSEFMENYYLTAAAVGILGYGIFYFLFHDILVHQRLRFRWKGSNRYLKRIIHAHYVHHETHSKKGAQAFGFLFAPKKYETDN